MDNDSVFTSIDKYDENNIYENIIVEDEKIDAKEAFVTGLPDWDLEPLYETIKRSDNK